MAIFNRKSEVAEEVPELERYYAERRTSSAWSWLMALVTMILTILIIIGLFFGGRWIYRELISDDNKSSAPTVNAPATTSTESTNQSAASGVATAPSGTSEQGSQAVNGGAPAPVTSSTSATAGQSSTTASSSSTASSSAALPNSGPGSTAVIALSSAAAAYLLGLYYFSKREY